MNPDNDNKDGKGISIGAGRDFFSGLYDDFFGKGSKVPDDKIEELAEALSLTDDFSDLLLKAGEEAAEKEKTSEDAAEVPEDETREDGGKTDAEEALKRARDAILEAKGLFGEERREEPCAEPVEPVPEVDERDPLEELGELIGLDNIKKDVRELAAFAKIQKLRKEQGIKTVPVSLHLVFTGNPGTGKTTVARILAKIYRKIGVLSKGQLVETDRSGLVAGYVGQTAIKTQEMIDKAIGGVLFIDEAYALSQKDDAFGEEAINTVLKAMEDHRDDLIVIVAGYTEPMEKFIASNPGLKSRFNKYIDFPDYTIDELEAIFELNCRKYDYRIDDEIKKHIRGMLVQKKLASQENFANAREVRNLFEEIITNQARRLAETDSPDADAMMTILPEDLTDRDISEVPDKLDASSEDHKEKAGDIPETETTDPGTEDQKEEDGA